MAKQYQNKTHQKYGSILAKLLPEVMEVIRASEGGALRRYSQDELHDFLKQHHVQLPVYSTLSSTDQTNLQSLLNNSSPKPFYSSAAVNHSRIIRSYGRGRPPTSGYCKAADVTLLDEIDYARQTMMSDQSTLYRTIGLWFSAKTNFTAYDTSAAINHGVGTNPDVSGIWESTDSPGAVEIHCVDAVLSQDMGVKWYGNVLNYKEFSHYQYLAVPMLYRQSVSPKGFPLSFHAANSDLVRRCESDGIGLLVVFIDDKDLPYIQGGKDPAEFPGTSVYLATQPRHTALSPRQNDESLTRYRLADRQIRRRSQDIVIVPK